MELGEKKTQMTHAKLKVGRVPEETRTETPPYKFEYIFIAGSIKGEFLAVVLET